MKRKEISKQLKIVTDYCNYTGPYSFLKKIKKGKKIYRYYVCGRCLVKKDLSFKVGHWQYPIWINYDKGDELYIIFDYKKIKFMLGRKGHMWKRKHFSYDILIFNFNKSIPFEIFNYNKIETEYGKLNKQNYVNSR